MLAIGRRLRAEYDAVAEPVPERLAALVKQLEAPVPSKTVEIAPTPSLPAQSPSRRDPEGHGSSLDRPAKPLSSAAGATDQGAKRYFG
jgi:Anti-sigma factor NepR